MAIAFDLPRELDFRRDRSASPDRMNLAMSYIEGRVRQVLALKPEFEAAIVELRDVGLSRLVDGLEPVFDRANEIAAALETIYAEYGSGSPLPALRAELLGEMDARAEALAEDRLDPLDAAVGIIALDFADLRGDRWFLLHG